MSGTLTAVKAAAHQPARSPRSSSAIFAIAQASPRDIASDTKRAPYASAVIVGTWRISATTSGRASDGAWTSATMVTGAVTTASSARCTGGYV